MTGWAMTVPLLLLLCTTIIKFVAIQNIDIVNKDIVFSFYCFVGYYLRLEGMYKKDRDISETHLVNRNFTFPMTIFQYVS